MMKSLIGAAFTALQPHSYSSDNSPKFQLRTKQQGPVVDTTKESKRAKRRRLAKEKHDET